MNFDVWRRTCYEIRPLAAGRAPDLLFSSRVSISARPSSGGRPWCCAVCWTLTPAVPPDFLSQAIITNHDVTARKFSPRQTGGRQNAINTTVEAFGVVSQMSRVETSRWRRTAESPFTMARSPVCFYGFIITSCEASAHGTRFPLVC